MRASGVVPLDPLVNGSASFGEAVEVVQPDALLLETTKEALDEAVLLWRIGCNELSNLQGAQCRSAPGKPPRALARLPSRDHARRTRSQSLPDHDRSITAVRWPQPSAPHGICVTSIAQLSSLRCARLLSPWTRGLGRQRTLMDEPTFEHKQSIHRLVVYADPFDETQHRPEASITEGRICFDQPLDAFRQNFVKPRRCRSNYRARPQPGTGKLRTLQTLRINTPGNVTITRRTSPAS
jgi:hypothetical protein